ncbi:MAG TPA: hypothetical protein VKE94_09520 [Gemmataceae bacterium]|nr:hypothetical protein [Gemmataceae bacterium]
MLPPLPPKALLFWTKVPFSKVSEALDQMPPPAATWPTPSS